MKKTGRNKRKLFSLFILGALLLWANDAYISYSSNELIFNNAHDIPNSEYDGVTEKADRKELLSHFEKALEFWKKKSNKR